MAEMDEAGAAPDVVPEAAEEAAAAAPATPEAEATAEPTTAAPESEEGEAAEAAVLGPEDEGPPAEGGLPSSSETDQEPPPPPAEGEAEAGEPAVAAEEGPASAPLESEEEGGGAPSEGPGEAEAEEAEAEEALSEALEAQPSSSPLPTHVTFMAGELPEPPALQVAAGDTLGRRLSLSLRELDQRRASAGSLGVGSSTESEESGSPGAGAETEEQRAERLAQEQVRREELGDQYRQLLVDRVRFRHYNAKLQTKLAEMLNKAKGGKEGARAAGAAGELEQHISDREQRYARYLAMLRDMRREQDAEVAWFRQQIDGLQRSCDLKLATVEAEWKAHQAIKKEVAVFTMGRRLGGRQAAIKEVDHIQAREQSKENEVTAVRLENIKLKHMIQKLEASLRVQEMLAEGLHLIDFEQLKIENQTYNEKIEERNEELLKLRRRITNTVQILSQVKEKLQFVEAENQETKAELMAIEAQVAQNREILTKTKQARDKLRMDNQKLYQKCGLLGNTLLLRDFENKVHTAEELNEKLELLKQRHAVLTHTCKGVKKKIKGVRNFLTL